MKKYRFIIILLTLGLLFMTACSAKEKTTETSYSDAVTTDPFSSAQKPSDTSAPSTSDEDVTTLPITDVTTAAVTTNGEYHYTYPEIVNRMIDPTYLAYGANGEKSAEFSSYDRSSAYKNAEYISWRANADHGGYLYKQPDGGFVIAEMDGPGYISRIWSADTKSGHVKIFIDGGEKPVFDLPFSDYFSAPAHFPFANLSYIAAQGKNLYVPITYNKSCKVVAYGDWGRYYEINYTTLPSGYTVDSLTSQTFTGDNRQALSNVNRFYSKNIGTSPYQNESTVSEKITVSSSSPYVKVLEGKGAISSLIVNPNITSPSTPAEAVNLLKDLELSIYWDGEVSPSVCAPLGDFFGSSYGIDNVRTLLLGVNSSGELYSFYYMPYKKSAKIVISYNGEGEKTLDLTIGTSPLENEENSMRFCARFERGEYISDTSRLPDYKFLSVTGKGRLVGLTLHAYKTSSETDPSSAPGDYWWGEGDEKFYVDGEPFPSWYGTGTEDFFGYAWCDPAVFTRAMHAQSYTQGGIFEAGNRVLTRLLISDSIPFYSSFDGYIEKYYGEDYIHYGFVPYYYLSADAVADTDTYTHDDYKNYFELDPAAYPTDFTEGENLYIVSSKGGAVSSQAMASFGGYWSGGSQLFFTNSSSSGELSLILPAKASGEYILIASFTNAPDYGRFSYLINDIEGDGSIDLYSKSVEAKSLTNLGVFTLSEGFSNTLSFKCTGRNTSSRGYFFGLDFVLIVPKDDFTSLEDISLDEYTSVSRDNAKPTGFATFEGESFTSNIKVSSGAVSSQSMTGFGSNWSMNSQLFWTVSTSGASAVFSLSIERSGEYDISAAFTAASDYGIIDIYIDDELICTYDGYHTAVIAKTISLGMLSLSAGEHTVKFEINGKNSSSHGYYVGFDYIKFTQK